MFDAIKLMRIPFSIFLMPVYWFALSQMPSIEPMRALHVFILVHIFVYPASNGYNSYFDKDEKSIGGLKNPPPVNPSLYPLVLLFDFLSIAYSYWISPLFAVFIFGYLLISKAYSYDKIRLKKYPLISTLVVTIFQGFYLFLSIQFAVFPEWEVILESNNLVVAACSSLFLLGSYPLTQVYQHQEDKERGDQTLSLLLGIKGTFWFSAIAFILGSITITFLFIKQGNVNDLYIFLGFGLPILAYFSYWFSLVIKNPSQANFKYSMRMNIISSLCLSAAFIIMLI